MIRLLTSSWMTALLSAVIYLGATVAFWKSPARPAAADVDTATAAAAAEHGPSWDFTNPEADQLIAELKAEKRSLAKREQQLADLTLRLQTERSELATVTQGVQHLQTDFDQNVMHVKEEETANLKKLAKVYAAMTPEGAASIFSELDDVPVVKIMVFMKDSETAAIFESMAKKGEPQAKRAAALSEHLRLAAFRNTTPK
jgi:flagellar motility protein MotE (MotC chaperone)